MHSSSRLVALVALGATFALAACGGSGSVSPVGPNVTLATGASGDGGAISADGYGPGTGQAAGPGAGNGYGPGPGPSDGFCGSACTGPAGPDPGDILVMLEAALQEEYNAEMLYRSVLAAFGPDTLPFATIAEAEARHVGALKLLFTRRELAAPPWAPVDFPSFGSLAEACAAGVEAELADAAFYTPYLQRTDLPRDVRNVFTNLQAASLENHLPAFELCR